VGSAHIGEPCHRAASAFYFGLAGVVELALFAIGGFDPELFMRRIHLAELTFCGF